jgi:hypothetical protein
MTIGAGECVAYVAFSIFLHVDNYLVARRICSPLRSLGIVSGDGGTNNALAVASALGRPAAVSLPVTRGGGTQLIVTSSVLKSKTPAVNRRLIVDLISSNQTPQSRTDSQQCELTNQLQFVKHLLCLDM